MLLDFKLLILLIKKFYNSFSRKKVSNFLVRFLEKNTLCIKSIINILKHILWANILKMY